MTERSAEGLLDWAYVFLCNAAPIIDDQVKGPWEKEAVMWMIAFEDKFKPAYHEWLGDRVTTLGVASPPERDSLSLDALVLTLSRAFEGVDRTGEKVVLVHIDTLRDIYEELARLQGLEK